MLSNTAIPKYYGEFREKVLRGEIPVCENISLEMNRIDELIENPKFYYDDNAVEGWIKFCEDELTLTDGSDLHMIDSFKIWGEQALGWFYFEEKSVYTPRKDGHGGKYVKKFIKKRLTNKQYLIVGRGASKTMYGHCMQSYGLVIDTDTTQGITTAPTMKQAEEMLSPFKTAILRSKGPLFKFLTRGSIQNTANRDARPKLMSTKKGIENTLTNSILEIKPMTIDKLQGYRNKYGTVDEWLSGDTKEDVIGAIEQGASKVKDYLILSMSSEGTIRNGVGDSIKMELMDILKGDYYAPNVSIWWYRLDDVSEVRFPELWIKANPNIGITVDWDKIQQDVERAENVPSARNDILAKRFGIPMEGYTYFFTYAETLRHKHRVFWKLPCALGCDLSRGDDFCAFTFLFPLSMGNRGFGVKTRAYITETTLMQLPIAMRVKYEEFIEEGSLIVMDDPILDMIKVYEDLDAFIVDSQYDVVTVGYDPYNAKDFVERWSMENGPYNIEKVIQGAKTESVPLGELKKLAKARLLLFDEALMEFCMGNCIVLEDTNGNRKLYKKRYEEKIDSVSALLDAFVAFKLHPDEFE